VSPDPSLTPTPTPPTPPSTGGTGGGSTGGGGNTSSIAPIERGNDGKTADADDSGNGIVVDIIEEAPPPLAANPVPGFDDLAGYEWAFDAINNLAARGIVIGDGQGRFFPGDMVARGDFVLMINRTIPLPPAETPHGFTDLPDMKEYDDAIGAASNQGIVLGTGENLFAPYDNIKRQEVVAIIGRLLRYTGVDTESAPGALSGFFDINEIDAYAADDMSYMVANGLILGFAGNLEPQRPMTRAEIAVFLDRVITRFDL
jgi:hypothetical protein